MEGRPAPAPWSEGGPGPCRGHHLDGGYGVGFARPIDCDIRWSSAADYWIGQHRYLSIFHESYKSNLPEERRRAHLQLFLLAIVRKHGLRRYSIQRPVLLYQCKGGQYQPGNQNQPGRKLCGGDQEQFFTNCSCGRVCGLLTLYVPHSIVERRSRTCN